MTIDLVVNELDHETIEAGDQVAVMENWEGEVMNTSFIGTATERFTNNHDGLVDIAVDDQTIMTVYAFTVGKVGEESR